jgi:hypothetical protein
VLVANGDSDPMILPHYSYLLAGLIPHAQLKIYPDSAHRFLFQHHAQFAADIGHSWASPVRNRGSLRRARSFRTEERRGIHMASEQVVEVVVRRHVFDSERPFSSVLEGIFGGISQPDIGVLFTKLKASSSYEQVSSLVRQAQGSAGLMRFLQLDLDPVLTLDPQAPDWTGRRLVRLIAGNPVTMGEMTRHVADAGSYAPVTILIQEMPDGGTRVAYDTVASEIAPYHGAAASEVAQRLDAEVLGLLRQVTGVPGSGPA